MCMRRRGRAHPVAGAREAPVARASYYEASRHHRVLLERHQAGMASSEELLASFRRLASLARHGATDPAVGPIAARCYARMADLYERRAADLSAHHDGDKDT
jgi:hypothetical protein